MAGTSNYNFSYNNPYGMTKPQGQAFDPMSVGKPQGQAFDPMSVGKPQGQAFDPMSVGKPVGKPAGKMFGAGPSEQVSWDNPGMQVQPQQQSMGGFSGAEPARAGGLTQGGSFVSPQFQGGMQNPGAYGQQLNRFMGHGGTFDQFKPRMGAVGPAYRNGMSARPFTPPPPAYKPPDENIGLPPQPVESTSYVQPNFGGGFQ